MKRKDQAPKVVFSSWHVGVAAEAVAAAQFARCGLDVSVQYGANQPEYDLIVSRGEQMMKVSVKGSQDGSWGLCQSLLKPGKADYHEAITKWLARHRPHTVLCLVQFQAVELHELPRLYLTTPEQVARRLHETAGGRGDTILFEKHEWGPRARGAGTIERIPDSWRFSADLVGHLLTVADVG